MCSHQDLNRKIVLCKTITVLKDPIIAFLWQYELCECTRPFRGDVSGARLAIYYCALGQCTIEKAHSTCLSISSVYCTCCPSVEMKLLIVLGTIAAALGKIKPIQLSAKTPLCGSTPTLNE